MTKLKSMFKNLCNLQVAGFALSLITVWIGIYQYSDAKEKEFKKTFYEERFKTYSELSETVAKIATLPHKSQ